MTKLTSYDWDIYDDDDNFLEQVCDEPTKDSALSFYNNNLASGDKFGFDAIKQKEN